MERDAGLIFCFHDMKSGSPGFLGSGGGLVREDCPPEGGRGLQPWETLYLTDADIRKGIRVVIAEIWQPVPAPQK
ncbi:hypothetical protein Emag_006610 [Eimeria magna]